MGDHRYIGDGISDSWVDDSVLNLEDNCPDSTNVDQLDTDGDGIGDACEEMSTSVRGIVDPALVKIYPNPAKDELHIRVRGNYAVSGITVINSHGRVIKQRQVSWRASDYAMDVADLPSGMYALRLHTEHSDLLSKFVVLR